VLRIISDPNPNDDVNSHDMCIVVAWMRERLGGGLTHHHTFCVHSNKARVHIIITLRSCQVDACKNILHIILMYV
jgi:hypothetical protein